MQTGHNGSIWKDSLRRMRRNWRPVLMTHLVYTVLGVVLFTPLVTGTGRLLLSLSSQPVLADQDIIWFLLSPVGMTASIFLAAMTIAISAFELATLLVLGAAGSEGSVHGVVAALRMTLACTRRIFLFSVHLVVRILLLVLPFVAITVAVAWFLLTDYDINYYLSERPLNYWLAIVFITALQLAMAGVLIRKLLAWSMALPLVLFAGVKPSVSFLRSDRLTNGRKRKLIRLVAHGVAWVLLAGLVISVAVQMLGSWVVPHFFTSITWLVPVLGAFIGLWMLGNFLLMAFALGSLSYLLLAFYQRYALDEEKITITPVSGYDQLGQGRKVPLRVLALTLPVAAVMAMLVGNWLMDGIQLNDTVSIVAHRGASGRAPENTLVSARQAIADGADWIEVDVQEAADGTVVVIHDGDFMKLAGVRLKVWEGSLEQIRAIDVGSWFDPQFAAERVPTLDEMLAEVKGKAGLLIELKYYGHDENLEQRVVAAVERAGMEDEVAIMSLSYAGIEKIRSLRPDWTYGFLAAKSIGNLATLDIDFLAVARGMVTPDLVRRAHQQGKQVVVWTINDTVTMSRMMSLGVDGVITDEPALARTVVADRRDLNPAERLMMHTAMLFGTAEPQRRYRDTSP